MDEDVAAGNVELCVVLSTSASSVECELTVTVGTVQNTAGMCKKMFHHCCKIMVVYSLLLQSLTQTTSQVLRQLSFLVVLLMETQPVLMPVC